MQVLRNLNGTITIKDKYTITISKRTVEYETAWINLRNTGAQKLWTPKPFECYQCGSMSMYKVSEKVVGPETAIVWFQCSNCGTEDSDVMD